MRIVLCLLCLLVIGSATTALAQPRHRRGYYPGYGHVYPGGYDVGHHSSTYEEGVQRGAADIIRSAGAYNLMTSAAMNNVEEARRRYIENRVYGTDQYFEMRRMNREARAAERGPRPTMETLVRLAAARKPNRLSPSELDPITGKITWPALLGEPQFKEDRQKLEEIYLERAFDGQLDLTQLRQVSSSVANMKAGLLKDVKSSEPMLYTQAKAFLEGLAYESRLPTG